MFIFQPHLVFIVSQSDSAQNVWDSDGYAMTDAADQVAWAFNWWREHLDIGFGWGNRIDAAGSTAFENAPRNGGGAIALEMARLYNELRLTDIAIFLGTRQMQPYGWQPSGTKLIFIAYNYLKHNIKTPLAHELGHLMGAQHNELTPPDIMHKSSPDLNILHTETLAEIREQYLYGE